MDQLKMGGIYEHYKGNKYLVREVVKHSETLECMVFYECLYDNPDGKFWVRPLEMFLEDVILNGVAVPRFKFIKLPTI